MPLLQGIRNEGNIDFRHTLHAISGQRYHDNTPAAVAAAEPGAVVAVDLWRFRHVSSRHVRGEKRRGGKKEILHASRRPQRQQRDKFFVKAETPQSRHIVAPRRAHIFFFLPEYRSRKRAQWNKSLFFSLAR